MPNTTDLGVDLIRAERERQITAEGYTPDHDLEHSVTDLELAALAYLLGDAAHWPWDEATFKPESTTESTVRDLVKAGALVAAAIDRLLAVQEA